MPVVNRHFRARALLMLAALSLASASLAADWLPVSPEELAMKAEPKAPGARAIFLHRQIDRNDNVPAETVYLRIKVLTEEGRELGNVQLPFRSGEAIQDIEARTIRPDGTVLEFNGTVYDKEVFRFRQGRLNAKTFSLPEVEVGSILEYRYRHRLHRGFVFDSSWVLSAGLFTRRASFSLVPNRVFPLRWSWPIGLPPGTSRPVKVGRDIRLETSDVPAFVSEEFMPPETALKYRVEFVYEYVFEKELDPYWRTFGRAAHARVEKFVRNRRALERAVAQIVGPADSAETKLRKLYARAQSLRNRDFEREKSEQEERREDLDDVRTAAEALESGYASAWQITWIFLGLARAAGFDADALLVSTRDDHFFEPRGMNSSQLNANVARVTLEGRELYLDPGFPHAPFGLLPWHMTGVQGLLLEKEGPTWVRTPLPAVDVSRIERKVALRITSEGGLAGRVAVTYTGLEALQRRQLRRNDEDAERRKALEEELTQAIPGRAEAKLVNQPDWNGPEAPLVAEFDLTVPQWGTFAAKRLLLPTGLFVTREQHLFEHENRVHPVYFEYPHQRTDDIALELPAGWRASNLPQPRDTDAKSARYRLTTTDQGASLRVRRELVVDLLLVRVEGYPALRNFLQAVRAGDGDTVVITAGAE